MPCFPTRASRPATSLSPGMTARDGLPPAKASASAPPSSIWRNDGKRSLRIAAIRSGGTRWPWTSTIMAVPFDSALSTSWLVTRRSDRVTEVRPLYPDAGASEGERAGSVGLPTCHPRTRRRRAEIAGFAGALLPEHGMRRRRLVVHYLDLGHLVRRRQEIIHEGLGDELALVVIGELLVERGADAVGDAAHGHAAHDLRVDHGAAVVADDVAPDLGLAEIRIDGQQQQMKLEGEAGIHLHPAVRGRQRAAGRYLQHLGEGEPGLGAGRQAVEVAVGDGDQLGEAAPGLRCSTVEHVAGD